jgi:hypothetical protein
MNAKCFVCLDKEVGKHKKDTVPISGCAPYIGKQLQKRILSEEQMRLLIYQVIDTMFCPPHEMTLAQSNKEKEEFKLYAELHSTLEKIAGHYEENYNIDVWKH